jgi:ABC-2 type transport system permease protein
MTAISYAARDSVTMLRRELRHAQRFPLMSLSGIGVPVFFLLLFVGVFGHTLHTGLQGTMPVHARYVDYLLPGILLMTVAATAETTAVNVCTDMSEGIIARFRTMPIARMSVLTGQVLGSTRRTLASGVLVVAVALALGFRPNATATEWLAAVGVFVALTFALTWMAVAFGLFAKTPAGANSLALLMVVLPFISSAFVPTDSMPAGVRWLAHNQPFTPVIETLRGLLTGAPIHDRGVLAIAWCAGITAAGYLWARARYDRAPA